MAGVAVTVADADDIDIVGSIVLLSFLLLLLPMNWASTAVRDAGGEEEGVTDADGDERRFLSGSKFILSRNLYCLATLSVADKRAKAPVRQLL